MARKLIPHHLRPNRTLATQNPEGTPVSDAMAVRYRVVRIGREGERTHLYDPRLEVHDKPASDPTRVLLQRGAPICLSGFLTPPKSGKRVLPKLYVSEAKYVTCYRCMRLIHDNEKRGTDGRKETRRRTP
jgi:hypothetical protein